MLFSGKKYCRNIVNGWCIWLSASQTEKSFARWAVLDNVNCLGKLIEGKVQESEIWFFDDGMQKVALGLLCGKLVTFKVTSMFSDDLLENFIKQMKKFSFESPKVRVFGSECDINYDYDFYSVQSIESGLSTNLSQINTLGIKNMINNLKCIAASGALSALCVMFSCFYSVKLHDVNRQISHRIAKCQSVKHEIMQYPKVEHVQSIMSRKKRYFYVFDFVKLLEDSGVDYNVEFSNRRIRIYNVNEQLKKNIQQIASKKDIKVFFIKNNHASAETK